VSLQDDSSISEINILSDGRVCLFGASRQVLEMLDAIPLGDPALKSRTDCLRVAAAQPAADVDETGAKADDGRIEEPTGTTKP